VKAIIKALGKDGVTGTLKYVDAMISGQSTQLIFSRS